MSEPSQPPSAQEPSAPAVHLPLTMHGALAEVREFFNEEKREAYRLLDSEVRRACKHVESIFGPSVVRTYYGRDFKQGQGAILKGHNKIAKALIKLRGVNHNARVSDVRDIIGLTVVVHYADQINQVKQAIIDRLNYEFEEKEVDKNGYYAHHVEVISHDGKTLDLYCEIQIKTMLHDAWAWKTHDLNYKPQGETDPRLASLMQVFGNALQAIELQSEMLRDLIHEPWEFGKTIRRSIDRLTLKDLLLWEEPSRWNVESLELLNKLKMEESAYLTADANDRRLAELKKKISSIANHSVRDATWLAVRIADIRVDEEFCSYADAMIKRFLEKPQQLVGVVKDDEFWGVPMAMASYGNFQGAIDESKRLLRLEGIHDITRESIKFNLANYLIERGCGTHLGDADKADLRDEVTALLKDCAVLEKEDPSCILDTRGMLEVVTSNDPKVIRQAITMIEEGKQGASAEEKEFADECYELHARLAWRRLLQLETRPPEPFASGDLQGRDRAGRGG